MIPTTPEECDGFIADVAAAVLVALAPAAFAEMQTMQQPQGLLDAKQTKRIEFATSEANKLLTHLQGTARTQRFDDGTVIDTDASDPTKRHCAHGVALADPCAQCAADDPLTPPAPVADISAASGDAGAVGGGDGDALAAFNAGLQGGPQS